MRPVAPRKLKSMHKLCLIAALTLLASPALASPRDRAPTASQWKDIRNLQEAFGSCGGWTDGEDKKIADLSVRKACALSGRLQDKLLAQGFCFYKRIEVGRPNKAKDACEPLTTY